MAAKTKKEAATALDSLQDYLRRDQPAREMLRQVDRYVGELRQSKAATSSENEQLKQSLAAAGQKREALEAENLALRKQLEMETAARRQAETTLTLEQQKRAQESWTYDPTNAWSFSEKRFWKLVEDVTRDFPRSPKPFQSFPGNTWLYLYDLRAFVGDFSDDSFKRLGQFLTLAHFSTKAEMIFTTIDSPRTWLAEMLPKTDANVSKRAKLLSWSEQHIDRHFAGRDDAEKAILQTAVRTMAEIDTLPAAELAAKLAAAEVDLTGLESQMKPGISPADVAVTDLVWKRLTRGDLQEAILRLIKGPLMPESDKLEQDTQ